VSAQSAQHLLSHGASSRLCWVHELPKQSAGVAALSLELSTLYQKQDGHRLGRAFQDADLGRAERWIAEHDEGPERLVACPH
jgi:hypothetical protein